MVVVAEVEGITVVVGVVGIASPSASIANGGGTATSAAAAADGVYVAILMITAT